MPLVVIFYLISLYLYILYLYPLALYNISLIYLYLYNILLKIKNYLKVGLPFSNLFYILITLILLLLLTSYPKELYDNFLKGFPLAYYSLIGLIGS